MDLDMPPDLEELFSEHKPPDPSINPKIEATEEKNEIDLGSTQSKENKKPAQDYYEDPFQFDNNKEYQYHHYSQSQTIEEDPELLNDLGLIADIPGQKDPAKPFIVGQTNVPQDQAKNTVESSRNKDPIRKPTGSLTLYDLEHYETMKNRNCGPPPGAKIRFNEMKTWEYLLYRDFREYQFYMVETCLFYNTLVSLPTGLGKTFIAVNVMNNYYRWFENGKIFFLAPSKPLVNQQMSACLESDAFKPKDLIELTGEVLSEARKIAYERGKIFFMTPQTLENDIDCERIDLERVTLVVYERKKCEKADEAHRAVGNYSYCEIQKALDKKNAGTRILALTATPGNDLEQCLEVVRNVRASKVLIKDEFDEEVAHYIQDKRIEAVHVQQDEMMITIEGKLNGILGRLASILKRCLHREESRIIPRQGYDMRFDAIKAAQDKFQAKVERYMQLSGPDIVARIFEGFSVAISLMHVKKTLIDQGYHPFSKRLSSFTIRTQKRSGAVNGLKREIIREWAEMKFLECVILSLKNPVHPKLTYLTELLHNFFVEKGTGSRAIVFTQSRASAFEIEKYLKFKLSNVTPRIFVGQGDREEARGMTQREQLQLINLFKKGSCNTLIATCVAEEGLDIGEVDLIVCYDNGLSPVRMVQRMGRTGRKREGKVILLLMDKEYAMYMETEERREFINSRMKRVFGGNESEIYLYPCNPRMVPDEITPFLRLVPPKVHGETNQQALYNTFSFSVPIALNQDEGKVPEEPLMAVQNQPALENEKARQEIGRNNQSVEEKAPDHQTEQIKCNGVIEEKKEMRNVEQSTVKEILQEAKIETMTLEEILKVETSFRNEKDQMRLLEESPQNKAKMAEEKRKEKAKMIEEIINDKSSMEKAKGSQSPKEKAKFFEEKNNFKQMNGSEKNKLQVGKSSPNLKLASKLNHSNNFRISHQKSPKTEQQSSHKPTQIKEKQESECENPLSQKPMNLSPLPSKKSTHYGMDLEYSNTCIDDEKEANPTPLKRIEPEKPRGLNLPGKASLGRGNSGSQILNTGTGFFDQGAGFDDSMVGFDQSTTVFDEGDEDSDDSDSVNQFIQTKSKAQVYSKMFGNESDDDDQESGGSEEEDGSNDSQDSDLANEGIKAYRRLQKMRKMSPQSDKTSFMHSDQDESDERTMKKIKMLTGRGSNLRKKIDFYDDEVSY